MKRNDLLGKIPLMKMTDETTREEDKHDDF